MLCRCCAVGSLSARATQLSIVCATHHAPAYALPSLRLQPPCTKPPRDAAWMARAAASLLLFERASACLEGEWTYYMLQVRNACGCWFKVWFGS